MPPRRRCGRALSWGDNIALALVENTPCNLSTIDVVGADATIGCAARKPDRSGDATPISTINVGVDQAIRSFLDDHTVEIVVPTRVLERVAEHQKAVAPLGDRTTEHNPAGDFECVDRA